MLLRAALILVAVFLAQFMVRFEVAWWLTPPGGSFTVGWLPGM